MIIDTNIAIALLVESNSKIGDKISTSTNYAPIFAKFEFLNILRKYHFVRAIPIDVIDQCYVEYNNLIDKFVPDEVLIDSAKILSFKLNHPIYDCLFLALALKVELTFVSSDMRLLTKAQTLGIETIHFSTI